MNKLILSLMILIGMSIPSWAVVSSTTFKNVYACDGTTTAWNYTFPLIDTTNASDLQVYTVSSAGVQALLTSNYSVNTQTLTVTYPISGSPCSVGGSIVLTRSEPLTQSVAASGQGPGPTPPVMSMSDKLTMIAQQLQGEINQSIQLPVSVTTPVSFPEPPGTSGQLLGWDPTGKYLINTVGVAGPQGPQGPAGSGSGNVIGPVSNTDSYVPQWNGVNSLVLKNGLAVGTGSNNLIQLNGSSMLPAVDGSLLSNINATTLATYTLGTGANNIVQLNGSGALPSVSGANVTNVNAAQLLGEIPGTSANNLVELDSSAKLPAVDGSQLLNLTSTAFFVPNSIQVFTTSGTWSKPANVSKVYVKVIGGGGGGYGATASNDAGGGSSGYTEGVIAVTGNVTVTVGTGGTGGKSGTAATAGGTSSFVGTTTIQATGGGAGVAGQGGAGGTASGGTLNISGFIGNTSDPSSTYPSGSGNQGGNTPLGYGQGGYSASGTGAIIQNGQGYGSGGGGIITNNLGGNGASGVVIVYY